MKHGLRLLGCVEDEESVSDKKLLASALAWGKDLDDIHADLPTGGIHTVVCVGINKRLGNAVFNTGAFKTVMDTRIAKGFSLKVKISKDGDCSKFGVPGSRVKYNYAGVIEIPFEIKVG